MLAPPESMTYRPVASCSNSPAALLKVRIPANTSPTCATTIREVVVSPWSLVATAVSS